MAETNTIAFRRNRLETFDLKRCDIKVLFPGESVWRPLLHVDDITPSYGGSTTKTRGLSSNSKIGLTYRDNDDPNVYTITVVSLNDKIKHLLNHCHDFKLDIGFMVVDRLSGTGMTFNACNVKNVIGRSSLAVGRESLVYTIILETYEKETENNKAEFDEEESDVLQPSDIFPSVNDIYGI